MDLISREEILKLPQRKGYAINGWETYVRVSDIKELPTAQSEIIRCKDCKHYQFADNRAFGMPVKMCNWFGFEDVDDDDFCSRAERRTDEPDR